MEPRHFDRVAKLFAARRLSRRQALTTGGASLAAGALAAAGLTATLAQEATPDAIADGDTTPKPMWDPSQKVEFLFVQTYQSGTITPTEGVDSRYTLTLEQGHGQTIYFSDRPDRVVGATDTPRFLEGLGFQPDNPPNAALVVETAPGETDVAVVELLNPLYDPVSQGVTYEIEVLANWQAELGIAFHEAPTDLAALAPSFGAAHLFIDDCGTRDIWCIGNDQSNPNGFKDFGVISPNADMCWNYSLCQPCEPYGHTYPSYCAGYFYWKEECNQQFDHCNDPELGCSAGWNWVYEPRGYCDTLINPGVDS